MNTQSRRAVPAFVVLGIVCAGILWLYTHMYVNPASAECVALYRAAKTAADTLMVDHSFPPSATRNAQPRTCGFVRTTARWQ